MSVSDVTDQNFESEVLSSSIPVVIDVHASWCGPCRIYSPVIEEVSKDYEGKVKFVKVDADDNQKVVERYNVMSIPTTLLIEKGEVKAMNVGAIPKEALRSWLKKNL